MRWRELAKTVEFSLGFGTAASVAWILLSLLVVTGLSNLELDSGSTMRFLVVLGHGVCLVLSMGVAGLIAGLLLLDGRWTFSILATLAAIIFRAATYLIAADPNPPWSSWWEIAVYLIASAFAILVSEWLFRKAGGRVARNSPS